MKNAKTMKVRTNFNPLRMMVGQKKPVQLNVEIKNKTSGTKSYSVLTKVPSFFGFDRSGLIRNKRKRAKRVKGKGKRKVTFDIYGKPGLSKGLYSIDIVVREHEKDRLDKTNEKVEHSETLRVEK